ncbi:MAG: LacI family transcriptional regulator [Proteobacteria bacterium]|nr:LacI family transcriptional regulator [Pseudomonadota bacterium]
MKKRPTQADVARMAGVSTATVSYVVNNQTEGRIPISPMTRDRVLEAIAKLGYQPDARAKSLRSGGTDTIGLLIPDMRNPHYWEIAEGIEDVAQAAGYEMLLASTSMDPQREIDTLHALTRRRVDALILVLSFLDQSRELLRQLSKQHYSVITLGLAETELDRVETGYAQATPRMMSHLFELGHRRIGFVHGVGSPDLASNRIKLFRECYADQKLALDEDLIVYCGKSMEDGYQATGRLLEREPRPTAIIAVNDLLAIGALSAIYERGLDVPGDISVAGFDDISMAAYLNPPLTTVRANAHEIGRQAAALAIKRILKPDLPVQKACVAAELVIRSSTGPAATLIS